MRALYEQILGELERGRITERYIVVPGLKVEGLTDPDGAITINPAHGIVDTVVHELLHRLHPEWSERYVRRTTSLIVNQLTDDDIEGFWRAYCRIVKPRKSRKSS